MAKKAAEETKDYSKLVAELKEEGVRPVYLICGRETYLQERLISAIAETWLKEEPSEFNSWKEDGIRLSAGQAADLANQMPFFAEKKLLIIENPGFISCRKEGGEEKEGATGTAKNETVSAEIQGQEKKIGSKKSGEEDTQRFLDYLKDPSPVTCLILWCRQGNPDKRDKFVKGIIAAGGFISLDTARPREALAFLKAMAEKAGKNCTDALLEQVLQSSPLGLTQGVREMDKLISYAGQEKLLTPEMAEQVLTPVLEANIFKMVDALGQKRTETAIRELRSLLDQGQSPYGIFAMMLRQFRLLIRTKAYLEQGYGKAQIAQLMQQRPFVIEKVAGQSRSFSLQALVRAFRLFQEKDLLMKSGQEPRRVLEDLILEAGGL